MGLLAGGILTQVLNWHWIFFVNLPVGAATAIAALRVIERDRGAGYRAGADVPGTLLITGAMMLGVFTIVDPAAQQGWLATRTLGLGAGSLALLGGFILRQLTARHPLMPLMRFGARKLMFPGLGLIAAGLALFAMAPAGGTYLSYVFPVTLLIGAGAGRGGPDRRLSPGLLDRLRPGGRGHRGRRHGPAPGPGRTAGSGRSRRSRAGRSHLLRMR